MDADTNAGVDLEADADAFEFANIPTLLIVLVQLTGDMKWLADPYRPARVGGMDDAGTGGLPEQLQAEVRQAAREAWAAYENGRPAAILKPDAELMHRMMEWSVGESVPASYDEMIAAELGFSTRPAEESEVPVGLTAIVIGAGISGLAAAQALAARGISFTAFERAEDLGGVWRANQYPGVGVDTPNQVYSYSFFPRDWSRQFGKREEILAYLEDFVDHFDLRESIRFGEEVTAACFDETERKWHVSIRNVADGAIETVIADFVISAVGIFAEPREPQLNGRESFNGQIFHSARWPDSIDLKDKRVAVVGSGSTACQIVSTIAPEVQKLHVFQRSPQWLAPMPKADALAQPLRWLNAELPFYREWYRFRISWIYYDKIHPSLRIDPEWPHPQRSINARNDRHREYFLKYLEEQTEGRPDLFEMSLPDYPPYGKRMVVDSGWFDALRRPNVSLHREAVSELTPGGVRCADGSEVPVDILVLATGFRVNDYLSSIEVRGRGGIELHETWDEGDARAYLGATVPGFPNFFIMYGPNINGAGGSYFALAESQISHILGLLGLLRSSGAKTIEPRKDVFDDYNSTIDEMLNEMVWSHKGMNTYYRNAAGRIVLSRPWSVAEFWHLLNHVDSANYELDDAADDQPSGPSMAGASPN